MAEKSSDKTLYAEMERLPIRIIVNEEEYEGKTESRRLLADFIREDLGLKGTHIGCEHGVCGACTVLLDGEAVRSCLLFAVQAEGAKITTVEGLARDGKLHPLQEAFIDHHALQCGFCTPGILLSAVDFLNEYPNPTEEQIREGISGSLCRCTGYSGIVDAILAVAQSNYKDRFEGDS